MFRTKGGISPPGWVSNVTDITHTPHYYINYNTNYTFLYRHLARQGHIPGGNYVRRVSDRVSEVGSENLGVSLFVGNGHTTFGREMTLAKVDCGPRNGGGGQVPCLEVKSMVFHFGRWQKYRTTRDNYLPPSLPFPLPLLLFSPLPFLLFFFLVLSVLSRLRRARFKSTKSTASDTHHITYLPISGSTRWWRKSYPTYLSLRSRMTSTPPQVKMASRDRELALILHWSGCHQKNG